MNVNKAGSVRHLPINSRRSPCANLRIIFCVSLLKVHYICNMFAMHFLFISGAEIFFIMFIVVMVFGADKIPGIAKGLGKGMRQLKDATEDIKQEIQKSADKQGIDTSFVKDIKKDIDDVKNNVSKNIGTDIKKQIDEVKKNVDDVTGTIKRK